MIAQIFVAVIVLAIGAKYLIAWKQGYGVRQTSRKILGVKVPQNSRFAGTKFVRLTKGEKKEGPMIPIVLLIIGFILLIEIIFNLQIL
jgi:hypothetical protein